MYAKLTVFRVVTENVDPQPNRASTEQNEPAPVFLCRLDVFEVGRYCRQQPVTDHVAAPAALVNIDFGIVYGESPRETELVGHERTICLRRNDFKSAYCHRVSRATSFTWGLGNASVSWGSQRTWKQ